MSATGTAIHGHMSHSTIHVSENNNTATETMSGPAPDDNHTHSHPLANTTWQQNNSGETSWRSVLRYLFSVAGLQVIFGSRVALSRTTIHSSNVDDEERLHLTQDAEIQSRAVQYFIEERSRLRKLLVQSMLTLIGIALLFGLTLLMGGHFRNVEGHIDFSDSTGVMYIGFLLLSIVFHIILLIMYAVRVAELHMNMHTQVITTPSVTVELLERYQAHRQRQIERLHRRQQLASQGNLSEDSDEDNIPLLTTRSVFEQRQRHRLLQLALDVDPTLLAPPPPSYAEANTPPPAYETIKDTPPPTTTPDTTATETCPTSSIQETSHATPPPS
jgi:hypothetical protein